MENKIKELELKDKENEEKIKLIRKKTNDHYQ
jgi:hypothetical protein